jgi:hypothetical protein
MAWHVVEKAAIPASPRTKNKEQRTKNKTPNRQNDN